MAASSSCTSATTTPCPEGCGGRTGHGRRPRMARSTTSPNGIRAWRCTTICAAGTRCPISAASFISNTATFDYAVTVPGRHAGGGLGRAGESGGGADAPSSARLAAGAGQRQDRDDPHRRRRSTTAQPPQTRRHDDLALPHGRTRATSPSAPSRAFIWDAARINLPGGKTALAQSVYPVESAGADGWGRSTEYLKHAVEDFSRRWFAYPWPNAINVGRPGRRHGISRRRSSTASRTRARTLFWITAHEIGHTWFPMMVGSNERRDAVDGRGLQHLHRHLSSPTTSRTAYTVPSATANTRPGRRSPADQIPPLIADPEAPPIMTRADADPRELPPPGQLFQIRVRAGPAARADPGPGALRLGVPQIHRRLGLQAPVAVGLLPRHGERGRRGSVAGSGAAGS